MRTTTTTTIATAATTTAATSSTITTLLCLLALALLTTCARGSQVSEAEQWIQLFNGRTSAAGTSRSRAMS